MELKDLSLALRRHWLVAQLAFAVCFAIGVASALLPEDTYRATAVVAVQPTVAATSSGGQSAIQTANYLLPIYKERLISRTFRERVSAGLDPVSASSGVSIAPTSDIGTGLLRIGVTSGAPSAAAAWANGLAEQLVTDANEREGRVLVLEVLDRAAVPTSPESGASTLVVGSIFLGVLAALLAALAASRMVRALDIGEEVRERLGTPILGEIPRVRALRSTKDVAGILRGGPRDVVESFQMLRTNVELALVSSQITTMAVTSFESGEGKSTVTAALGLSLSTVGHKVTMIDADLRQSSLHLRLGEPFGEGLADTHVDPERLVRSISPGLQFLPAGVPDRHPADTIAYALPRVVSIFARSGALLLIDGPPLRGVAETPFIASTARHVVIVVDVSRHNLPELERAVTRLRESGVVLFGVVLNRTRRRRNSKNNPYYAYSLAEPASALSEHNGATVEQHGRRDEPIHRSV